MLKISEVEEALFFVETKTSKRLVKNVTFSISGRHLTFNIYPKIEKSITSLPAGMLLGYLGVRHD